MSFQGQKNIYLCPKCGRGFVSQDIDKGTTPMFMKCLHCGSLECHSLMYRCPQRMLQDIAPAIEFYHPGDEELKKLSPGMQDHVKTFGLISRLKG